MKKQFKTYNLNIPVRIGIAPKSLSNDVVMFELLRGVGDKNNTQYTKDSFIKEIENGNVLVVLLKDDPIAYAVISDTDIAELYISYTFRSSELEELIKKYVKKHL
jgi:predicted lactoylglutathione lyase